jgi:TATA-box binding protein (TBP) (component of TFIID and TFIIIB)
VSLIFPRLRIATTSGFTLLIFVSGNFIVTGLKSYETGNPTATNLLVCAANLQWMNKCGISCESM